LKLQFILTLQPFLFQQRRLSMHDFSNTAQRVEPDCKTFIGKCSQLPYPRKVEHRLQQQWHNQWLHFSRILKLGYNPVSKTALEMVQSRILHQRRNLATCHWTFTYAVNYTVLSSYPTTPRRFLLLSFTISLSLYLSLSPSHKRIIF
jgi:hypothetical protein